MCEWRHGSPCRITTEDNLGWERAQIGGMTARSSKNVSVSATGGSAAQNICLDVRLSIAQALLQCHCADAHDAGHPRLAFGRKCNHVARHALMRCMRAAREHR